MTSAFCAATQLGFTAIASSWVLSILFSLPSSSSFRYSVFSIRATVLWDNEGWSYEGMSYAPSLNPQAKSHRLA